MTCCRRQGRRFGFNRNFKPSPRFPKPNRWNQFSPTTERARVPKVCISLSSHNRPSKHGNPPCVVFRTRNQSPSTRSPCWLNDWWHSHRASALGARLVITSSVRIFHESSRMNNSLENCFRVCERARWEWKRFLGNSLSSRRRSKAWRDFSAVISSQKVEFDLKFYF